MSQIYGYIHMKDPDNRDTMIASGQKSYNAVISVGGLLIECKLVLADYMKFGYKSEFLYNIEQVTRMNMATIGEPETDDGDIDEDFDDGE